MISTSTNVGAVRKGEIKLKCEEQSFPEFPNLLFGQSEAGRSYFDATLSVEDDRSNAHTAILHSVSLPN